MKNTLNIFIFACLSAFFIYTNLTTPVGEYGNDITEPGFVTPGDTVKVELPLVDAGIRYRLLQSAEAVPLVVNSDTIFWDTEILDIEYSFAPEKRDEKSRVTVFGSHSSDRIHLPSRDLRSESEKMGGKRFIKLVIPRDERLAGQRLYWNLRYENDPKPHGISIRISTEQDRSKFVLHKAVHKGSLVLAVASTLMLLWTVLGRTGIHKTIMSRRLRGK